MNEINELKEKLIARRMKWMRSETTQDYVISDMMDLLIGITEHLDARPAVSIPTCQVIGANTVEPLHWTVTTTQDAARRDATIKTLRWVCIGCSNFHHEECPSILDECHIREAIARLENGGDL